MFVSGGFYITRSVPRPGSSNSHLLPERVVIVSRCLTKFLPDTWCIEWTNDSSLEHVATAAYFGLDENVLFGLISEMTAAFGTSFGWPSAIWDLQFARSIANSFLADTSDIRILEPGLHSEYVGAVCQEAEPKQFAGFAPVGRQGIHEAILRMQPVESTRVILGFEPLVWNQTQSCSWLCNGLEIAVAKHLGTVPNANGLIDTFAKAQAAALYIGRNEIGAEPGLWVPWLIIEHARQAGIAVRRP
jgi:hypothetical protein